LPKSIWPLPRVVAPVPPLATLKVPVVSLIATLREEVATQLGRPVVYELVRKLPVEVASGARAVVPPETPPMRSAPSATVAFPVPPLPTPMVPLMEMVGDAPMA
jgi:hypothetical protein